MKPNYLRNLYTRLNPFPCSREGCTYLSPKPNGLCAKHYRAERSFTESPDAKRVKRNIVKDIIKRGQYREKEHRAYWAKDRDGSYRKRKVSI